jgi:DNA ligase 1
MTSAIEQAFNAFEAIESTTSRTEKENILKANKDNEILKELLVLTYNAFIVFGVKKDPGVAPEGTGNYEDNYPQMLTLLEDLSERRLTGNLALEAVRSYFSHLDEREYKWYLRIMQRDLKIGITEKTVNKIWKGLVPVFTCALANSYDPKKMPARFVADIKFDGYRCLAFKYHDGRVELRTRNGHLLEGYAGIEHDVATYLPPGFIYDGEIMARSGAFNDVQKSAFKKGEADKDGILNIFDVVSIEEFVNDTFHVVYEARLGFLDQISDILDASRSLARVYPTRVFTNTPEDLADLFVFHTHNVDAGHEGTMIKNLAAKYKKDKSNNILKMKDFYEIDLVVTGVYEGKTGTKYAGTLGGVTVDVSDFDIKSQCPVNDPKHTKKLQYVPNGTFEVSVGSGWADADRNWYWKNPNDIIGKTIQISFQETTLNEKGGHSLRFPTVVKVRNDK